MLRYLFVFIILFLLAIEFPAFTSHGEEEKPFDYKRDITLPDGFVIERIAGPPLVRHPLHICLDDQGHAYVTEMAGINRNGKQLEQELPNSILRLIDSDQDGIFDQATTFADKMTFPSGVLWYRGAVYATSFPWLWKLKDTNGDGIADERTPLVGKFGSIGNGADLHGPQLGPDGWLYFCDGRNGHDVQLGDGSRLEGHASGLYRCKPDGTRLERIFAGGMDNPVEVAFSAAGEPFVCTNLILNSPRHDGVLLGIDGAVYPYDLKAVQQVPWTGQYLPIMGDLGWVAVSSIAQQQTQAWGDKYLAKYLVAEFNTHRIQVLQFTRQGASFSMQAEPFLDCRHPDFHPTQLVFAPDGSLLVVDTGGWFRNGCPTSRIEKPSVQGGIYRIRLQNQAQKGYAISKDQSVTREKLKQQIASENTTERLQALWALGKGLAEKEDAETQQLLREGLLDNDVDCVITAMRFAGQYRDVDAYDKVLIQLEHAHQAVRREAAATLARLRNTEAIPHLMQALGHADDPFLEHACIHALIQLKHRAAILEGLKHSSSRVQRGCLIALEQISKDILQWDHVAQLMQVHDARLQQACLEVMRKHPEWVHDLADYVDRELSQKHLEAPRLQGTKVLLTALAPHARIQQLLADRLACPEERGMVRFLLLDVMQHADLKPWPTVWIGPLQQLFQMADLDYEIIHQAVLVAGASQRREFDESLRQLMESSDHPWSLRVAAACVALHDGKAVTDAVFQRLQSSMKTTSDPLLRLNAVRALSIAHLNSRQLVQLQEDLEHCGPLELPLLFSAWERAEVEDRSVLVAHLMKSPGLAAISLDRLQKFFEKVPRTAEIDQLFQKGRPDTAAQQTRLDELKPILTGGDPKKGREIFFGTKAACSTCHRVGSQGGLIGPHLTTIGLIRTRSDLLESILFPNASLARGYETLLITTRQGVTYTGVLTRETADAVVLTDSRRQEQKVLRSDIEEIQASAVSTMPAGLDQQLTKDELQHLLAYLESLKK